MFNELIECIFNEVVLSLSPYLALSVWLQAEYVWKYNVLLFMHLNLCRLLFCSANLLALFSANLENFQALQGQCYTSVRLPPNVLHILHQFTTTAAQSKPYSPTIVAKYWFLALDLGRLFVMIVIFNLFTNINELFRSKNTNNNNNNTLRPKNGSK